MEQPGIVSRMRRVIWHLTSAFREGYNRDPGIRPPKILTDRQKPPAPEKKSSG